ncbi:hypothetical protein TRIP_C90011 [Candidatus Zixiibacteriota bacterium]|nr:hypothetical protein TRIP_C90011 [candidate division Zixibacteria bacterium]
MNESKQKEMLSDILCRVFEQTAFLFPEKVDLLEGMSLDEFEMLSINLKFAGDREGETTLIIPVDLCRELAANLLGEDPCDGTDREKCYDAAREMLNIITGQILTETFGEKALFNLSSPQTSELARDAFFAGYEQGDYVCCTVDDYPIFATMKLKEKIYEHQGTGC